jgi:preprotein translocase subunit SecG
MLNIILIIGIIAAGLMIAIVLVQNPKGGGLASNFSSSNQIFGVKRTTEGVEKLTWIFATVMLLVSLAASSYNGSVGTDKKGEASDSKIQNLMDAKAPKTAPSTAPSNNVPSSGGSDAQGGTPPETTD